MIGAAEVRALLPHRYPILLVDRVRELVPGERIVAEKVVTAAEPWYARIADPATMSQLAYPVGLVLESWGQSAGVLVTSADTGDDLPEGSMPLFGSAGGVEVHREVFPGDRLTHHAEIVKRVADTVVVAGHVEVDGEIVLAVSQAVMAFRAVDVLRRAPEPAASTQS